MDLEKKLHEREKELECIYKIGQIIETDDLIYQKFCRRS